MFLSTKIFDITVAISILNMKGAWSLESPAPIEVATGTRLTLLDFMAERIVRVESVSMISPTYWRGAVQGKGEEEDWFMVGWIVN